MLHFSCLPPISLVAIAIGKRSRKWTTGVMAPERVKVLDLVGSPWLPPINIDEYFIGPLTV